MAYGDLLAAREAGDAAAIDEADRSGIVGLVVLTVSNLGLVAATVDVTLIVHLDFLTKVGFGLIGVDAAVTVEREFGTESARSSRPRHRRRRWRRVPRSPAGSRVRRG